jgi:hypothetical protein
MISRCHEGSRGLIDTTGSETAESDPAVFMTPESVSLVSLRLRNLRTKKWDPAVSFTPRDPIKQSPVNQWRLFDEKTEG